MGKLRVYFCVDCHSYYSDYGKVTSEKTISVMRKAGRIEDKVCNECDERRKAVARLNVARESCSCSLDKSEYM